MMEISREFLEQIFKFMAPGTPLRQALDRIQEASLGVLIVLTEFEDIEHLVDGGFLLDTPFSPQKIYELSKMDGGIIINREIDTILGANIQMQPDPKILTDESGTRHRTAHRLAKQTGDIVITISERRHKITVFKGNNKYTLNSIDDLLIRSSQALRSLEKYAEMLDKYLVSLSIYEFEESVTVEEVLNGLRHFSLLFDMQQVVDQYILELGREGHLVNLQYQEIMKNKESECLEFLKDYYNPKKDPVKIEKIYAQLKDLNEDRYDNERLLSLIGYDKNQVLDKIISPKGYRFLHNLNKITKKEVDSLIDNYHTLPNLLEVTYEELVENKLLSKIKIDRLMRYIYRYKKDMEDISKNSFM